MLLFKKICIIVIVLLSFRQVVFRLSKRILSPNEFLCGSPLYNNYAVHSIKEYFIDPFFFFFFKIGGVWWIFVAALLLSSFL